MHESWTTCPRVTNFDDADVTDLEKIRVSSKDDYAKKGIKLTSLPFVIKAVARRSKPSGDQRFARSGARPDHLQGICQHRHRRRYGAGPGRAQPPQCRRAEHCRHGPGTGQIADNVRDGSFSVADLQGSTFSIHDADRAAAGIAALPATLEEATDALRASTVLRRGDGRDAARVAGGRPREGARRRDGHQRRRALRALPVPVLATSRPGLDLADVIAINTPLESP